MLVTNKTAYSSNIYLAVIVNNDVADDPEQNNRVQIYIPTIHYDYAYVYRNYMGETDKKHNQYFSVFPWAVSLVAEPKNGDTVYGSFIEGSSDRFIVLGSANGVSPVSYGLGLTVTSSELLNLTMPIILHNEIGLSITAWEKDEIPDSKYTTITLHDGSTNAWALGLLQWNGSRAFDLLYNIAKNVSNWESCFAEDCDLKRDLKASVRVGSSSSYRDNGYGNNYNPEVGSNIYSAIQQMLGLDKSKEIQKSVAKSDISQTILELQEEGVTNPALLIYLADLMNQYGKYLPDTRNKAVALCKTNKGMIEQLDDLVTFIKSWQSYNTYLNRRNTTYSYIVDLYNNGKLTEASLQQGDLTDIEGGATGNGQYSLPFRGTFQITAVYGVGGYHGDSLKHKHHTGVDIALNEGTPLYACTSGNVYQGSGYGIGIYTDADDGNTIIYGHCSSIVKTGRVNKGDLIGYSGNTGNSTGPHLHFEVRVNGSDVNPLPYLGLFDGDGNQYYYDRYISG